MEEILDSFKIDFELLLSRPSSAEPLPPPNPNFVLNLDAAIHTCQVNSNWREQCYGDKAQESRAGFTPDDVRERYITLQDEFKRLDALPTPGSCNSSDSRSQLHTTADIRSPSLSVEAESSSLTAPTTNLACADAEAPANGITARKRRYSQTSPLQATDHHVLKKRPNGPDDIMSTKIFSSQKWKTQDGSGKISRTTSHEWDVPKPFTRATLTKWKEKNSSLCQPTADFLRNCLPQDLKSLQRSARHGGPDLSNLRGVRYVFPLIYLKSALIAAV